MGHRDAWGKQHILAHVDTLEPRHRWQVLEEGQEATSVANPSNIGWSGNQREELWDLERGHCQVVMVDSSRLSYS